LPRARRMLFELLDSIMSDGSELSGAEARDQRSCDASDHLLSKTSMKYDPLRAYLQSLEGKSWTASFDELEQILGAALPPSAHNHREWWANTTSHPHSSAWLSAGWQVESVYPARRQVTFKRLRAPRESFASSPAARREPASPERRTSHSWDSANVVECGVRFHWIPIGCLVLDAVGKLYFPPAPSSPGLYRFWIRAPARQSVYVGETSDLQRRFRTYRTPGTSQLTNIRLQRLLADALQAGSEVAVAVVTSAHRLDPSRTTGEFDLASKAVRMLLENAALISSDASSVESLNRASIPSNNAQLTDE
jgi:hypothetical protein